MRYRPRITAAVVVATMAAPLAAETAGAPIKISTGKPFGSAQTSSTIDDPQVDGQILRVVVGAAAKPWNAGINLFVAEKVAAGDRIRATLWLRASQVESGKTAIVQAAVQQGDAPYTAYGKPARFTLTDKFAPYVVEGVVPAAIAPYKVTISMQLAFAAQTVDVAGVQAVRIAAAP